MDRRKFIGGVASGLLVTPLAARAQQQGKVWRIGFFFYSSRQSALDTGRYNAFVEGMRDLGYVEGKNFIIEARYGNAKIESLPELAAELFRLKVDVIVASGSEVNDALRRATTTIPVVLTITFDPVGEGFAASLARPGGNFTGLSAAADQLGPKQLELLMVAVPRISIVGVLFSPDNPSHAASLKALMVGAQNVGVRVASAQAHTVANIESAFASLVQERAAAVIVLPETYFTQQFQQIAQASLDRRVPSIAWIHEYVQAGGLMSYGADLLENYRRAATYVDKIFKGARPGELPFEQPTRYTLAINVKTARTLGLTIPQSLLVRADEVIQ